MNGTMDGNAWTGSVENIYSQVANSWDKAKQEMGTVNLLVTGKTGSGKSTLINAVFRKEMARAGIGRPVTQETKLYEDPDLPLRIYDTKGLELGSSTQAETMAGIRELIREKWKTRDENQFIHAIWYCVNCGTNRVEEKELEWINSLCAMGEAGVPVIVVLTQVFRKKVAKELEEVIDRELAGKPFYEGCFPLLAVADEEDPEKHPAFGLNDLVEKTYLVIPNSRKAAFVNAQGVSIDAKAEAARKYIKGYILSSFGTGFAPLPLSDAPLLIANEIAMCTHMTAIFGIALDEKLIASIVTALVGVSAATIGGKTAVSGIMKLIPGPGTILGGIVSGMTAATLTAALGQVYIAVLEQIARGQLKKEDLNSETFKDQLRQMMKAEMDRKAKPKTAEK